MEIEPFVYTGSPMVAVFMAVYVVIAILFVVAVAAYLYANDSPGLAVITIIALLGGATFLGFGVNSVANGLQSAVEQESHYEVESAKILDAYPQIDDAGVALDASALVEAQGKPVALDPGYERTDEGLREVRFVAVLNEDWTVDIFETIEGDELLKIEPQG